MFYYRFHDSNKYIFILMTFMRDKIIGD